MLLPAVRVMNHSVDMALLAGGALTAGALLVVAPYELSLAAVALRNAAGPIRAQIGYSVASQSNSPAFCAPGTARVSVW